MKKIKIFPKKFSVFSSEKQSLYIARACFGIQICSDEYKHKKYCLDE